jgi:ABC-2 type transport system ATP-binding protein
LQEVEAICDRVIIINKGVLVADDKLANLYQKGNNDQVRVSFKEPLEAEWLKRLPGVSSVNKVDTFTWKILGTDTNEVKKQLLELSLQHNLNIVSLQTEGGSLEEIFRSLTRSNKE